MVYGFMNTLEMFCLFVFLEDTFFLNCIIYFALQYIICTIHFCTVKKLYGTFYIKDYLRVSCLMCCLRCLYSNFWMKIVYMFTNIFSVL